MTAPGGAASGWEQARRFPGVPPEDATDRRRVIETPRGRYWEVTGYGWDAMLAYLADPRGLTRYPETRRHRVEVTVVEPGGARRVFHTPRTVDDQAIVDESVNSYLRDVGLPEQPVGWRWFQRLPDGVMVADIDEAVQTALTEAGLPVDHHPAEAVPVIRSALARLYGA